MSNLEAAFKGAAGEIMVAQRLLNYNCEVFVPLMHSGEVDLVARPECGDLISIQVKVAYEREEDKFSFHAGNYETVDYYAIVYGYKNGREIAWLRTWDVEANNHASLTEEMKAGGSSATPQCPSPICELERVAKSLK